jgi:hypothetical protein
MMHSRCNAASIRAVFSALHRSAESATRSGDMDYLPRAATYRQYRCRKCSSWLTIDLKSRIKLFALASVGIIGIGVGSALLLVYTKAPVRGHERLMLLLFAIVFGSLLNYAMARYVRKVAVWKAVDD